MLVASLLRHSFLKFYIWIMYSSLSEIRPAQLQNEFFQLDVPTIHFFRNGSKSPSLCITLMHTAKFIKPAAKVPTIHVDVYSSFLKYHWPLLKRIEVSRIHDCLLRCKKIKYIPNAHILIYRWYLWGVCLLIVASLVYGSTNGHGQLAVIPHLICTWHWNNIIWLNS
jgi:hypothetical protein